MRNRKPESEQTLTALNAVDATSRRLLAREEVEFKCYKCSATGMRVLSEAKKCLKNHGFGYQCPQCLKNKSRSRGPEWLANVRAAAQSHEHKARASENSKNSRKKYFPSDILDTLNAAGVTYVGSLDSPNNIIKVSWSDGVSRSIRIRKFMLEGLQRPKTGNQNPHHSKYLSSISELGLTVQITGSKRAKISYKGHDWEQYWVNHVDKKCLRMIKNIDIGLSMQEMIDSGMPLNKVCKALGVDPNRYYKNRRMGISAIDTSISTRSFEQLIKIDGAVYNKAMDSSQYDNANIRYRPDIRIDSAKLIIETDGMKYHAEDSYEKSYHTTKWSFFNQLGYNFLAFSEYEVKEKRPIVDSMIKNKMLLSDKAFARECSVVCLEHKQADSFFETNHLHGKGQGSTLALEKDGRVLCALRYREEDGQIHISRFANALGLSVNGGYSRLLARLPKDKDIVNFVDRRHGSGEHLLRLGFIKKSVHIGFEWTDGYYHFNRRKYLGNSGYDYGLKKFWDYGQVKYVRPAVKSIIHSFY